MEKLSKTFRSDGMSPVLTDVDLSIGRGEYVALVGRSGSGKSTLLNLMGLLDVRTSGRLWILGADVSTLSEAQRSTFRGSHLGFVFQDFYLLAHRSALENVALGLLYSGASKRARLERARQRLQEVGLSHRLEANPSTLSGGERQRVAIARALVGRPDLLLCDEPTGNLDPESSSAILDIFDRLRSEGMTVVVVTHDDSVADRADRVFRIANGRPSELGVRQKSRPAMQ